MRERQTVTITTDSGFVAVINTWITGRERQYIEEPMFNGIDVRPQVGNARGGQNMQIGKIDMAKLQSEQFARAIEKFVVSVDGETDSKKIVDMVLDMPEKDMKQITDTYEPKDPKKNEDSQE